MRPLAGMISVFVAIVGLPAAASAATTLAHDNFLTSSHPGYAAVELPRDVKVDEETPTVDWDFEGGATWLRSGVLRSEQPGPDGLPIELWFWRYEGESATGKWTLWWGILWGADRLRAGAYRFYLITNAPTPTRARLSFRDLSGTNDMKPEVFVPFTEKALRPSGIGIVKFGSSDGIGESSGAGFLSLRTDATTQSADRLEYCLYEGGDEKAGPQAYDRGCPGGTSSSDLVGITTLSAPYKGEDTGMITSGLKPGRWGMGGNATIVGVPPKFDIHAGWLSWDNRATAPVAPAPASPGVVVNAPDGSTATRDPGTNHPVLGPGTAHVTTRTARVVGKRAVVSVACDRETAGCKGGVRVGSGPYTRFSIPAGAREKQSIRLTAALQRGLRRHRSLRARAEVRSRLSSGEFRERRTVRLVAQRRR